MDFTSVEDGAGTVSDIIAAGMVPAAVEMMDQLCLGAVEAYIHAGLPVDAAAALLVEVVGLPHGVAADVARIEELARRRNVRTVRIAADDAERALLWKGRKSAFGAIARIKPNYYLHDTVVPRAKLPAVLNQVYEIADRHDLLVLNVFHAGDGNLHPLLVFDKREPGVMERVHAAGEEIVRASVEAGGVLSGEHGIGLEKRDMMHADVLAGRPGGPAGAAVGVRPARAGEPGQGAAEPGDVRRRAGRARGCMDLTEFAEEIGDAGPITIAGLATRRWTGRRGANGDGPGRDRMDPGRGDDGAVAAPARPSPSSTMRWRRTVNASPFHRRGRSGGALAVGQSGIRRLGLRARPRRAAAGAVRLGRGARSSRRVGRR